MKTFCVSCGVPAEVPWKSEIYIYLCHNCRYKATAEAMLSDMLEAKA